jgi:hypothetical protein
VKIHCKQGYLDCAGSSIKEREREGERGREREREGESEKRGR